jgi:Ca2+/Na+ antiporter
MAQSLLLLLLTIGCGILASNFTAFNSSILLLIGAIFMLLLAVIFLFLRQTRQRFLLTGKDVLSMVLLYAILTAFYFFLQ